MSEETFLWGQRDGKWTRVDIDLDQISRLYKKLSRQKVDHLLSDFDDNISPAYYQFPKAEVKDISSHLTSNGGQALQYVARSTRLDGNNKGDRVENLRKAIQFCEFEIERIEND